ncbi:MAG: CRISPR-associated endonuclease Cas1 [Armatimonadota bacterium]
MRTHSTQSCANAQEHSHAVKNGLCILQGFGVSVSVDGQHLFCRDGFADERREFRLSRATSGLKRLVIIGHSGSITLDALRWLYKLEVGVSVIDTDGNVILASIPVGRDYPHLRRAQALAYESEVGESITRMLLHAKLTGQAHVLHSLNPTEAKKIAGYLPLLENAHDAQAFRLVEAPAAAVYWQCWENMSIRFTRQDSKNVPAHWLTFGLRSSPITGSSRKAVTPGNALLNYLYAILETETTLACQRVGLDPGLGFLHLDQMARDSLPLDIMETVRPQVEAWLLAFLQRQTFQRQDFHEEETDGCVRIAYDIRTLLMETAPKWAAAVAPWVERVAQVLSTKKLPTRLTETNRSQGRDGVRKRKAKVPKSIMPVKPVCRVCGAEVKNARRRYCDQCFPAEQVKQGHDYQSCAAAALKDARENGKDPAHGGEAAQKRSETQQKLWKAKREIRSTTKQATPEEREYFTKEIQPKLKGVPLSAITNTTGLSVSYAALIKKGKRIPHPVHFQVLLTLIEPNGRQLDPSISNRQK